MGGGDYNIVFENFSEEAWVVCLWAKKEMLYQINTTIKKFSSVRIGGEIYESKF